MDGCLPKDNLNQEEQETLKKAYWEVLFNGQNKLGLSDSELSEITRIHLKTLSGWHNNKNKELPFFDLTRSDGIFVKQFMDLYINLRSIYSNEDSSLKWMRETNPSLKGMTPIEFMSTEENGIFLVNSYLKSLGGP